MTGVVSRPQSRRQQASAVAFEDHHGMIHVLAVGAVEEAELLLAVSGIVGGIEIEQDLTALANLLATETDELLAHPVVGVHQIAARRGLPAAKRGLGTESVALFLICDDLQQGIVAQTIGVVGVFIPGHELSRLVNGHRLSCCTTFVTLCREMMVSAAIKHTQFLAWNS